MTKQDLEMKDVSAESAAGLASKDRDVLNELLSALALVELSATHKDIRHISRALRIVSHLKGKLTAETIDAARKRAGSKGSLSFEVSLFLDYLLVASQVQAPFDAVKLASAAQTAERLVSESLAANRRTADILTSKIVFYYFRAHELLSKSSTTAIRPNLLTYLRTASLRHDDFNVAMLLNLCLRSYLSESMFDAADKLAAKTPFPDSRAGSTQLTRYLYYMGHIKAVQLDYATALNYLQQALRKAPSGPISGFRVTVTKLTVLVMLLVGDVPERHLFKDTGLGPYYELTRVVRIGDLTAFKQVAEKYSDVFQQDGLATLINRLRHNVIKIGLRKINLAYSQISFADIAKKVGFDGSLEDIEGVVAKAVREGVIEGQCNHDTGCLRSRDVGDVYATDEPMAALRKRILFCLDIHNASVKAMRFHDNAHSQALKDAAEMSLKLQQEEEEIAAAMEDGADDDDEGF